jgi:hypothetical protein
MEEICRAEISVYGYSSSANITGMLKVGVAAFVNFVNHVNF